MRHFTSVLVVVSLTATGASAQSVLERVLGQIDGATNLTQVNGVYANIAESIGDPGTIATPTITTTETVPVGLADAPDDTYMYSIYRSGFGSFHISAGDIGTTFTAGDGTAAGTFLSNVGVDSVTVNDDGTLTINAVSSSQPVSVYNSSTDSDITFPAGPLSETILLADDTFVYLYFGEPFLFSAAIAADYADRHKTVYPVLTQDITTTVGGTSSIPGLSTTIDGSITNIITGVTTATAEAALGVVTATEFTLPTFDLGDMATTALGAVNTGAITLGVNAAVDEAVTTTTRAISAAMTQIGGAADTGALVLNVASNASAVNGSIQNTMIAVNGSIGSASTTALGAVNTGNIVSGVDAAVQGIVGMSGQNTSGL
ncbi:MAG: hypothetical protein IKD58_10505 [Loktanella sp.]|nr:hypothetical protein [Loktanella sp.]